LINGNLSPNDIDNFLYLWGGAMATILINSCMEGFSQELAICGTEGRLVARDGDLRGTKRGGREELLLLEMEDQGPATDNTSPCLSRWVTLDLNRNRIWNIANYSWILFIN
jgi:hypothetical protein